jgi:hypothetical protein
MEAVFVIIVPQSSSAVVSVRTNVFPVCGSRSPTSHHTWVNEVDTVRPLLSATYEALPGNVSVIHTAVAPTSLVLEYEMVYVIASPDPTS